MKVVLSRVRVMFFAIYYNCALRPGIDVATALVVLSAYPMRWHLASKIVNGKKPIAGA